MPDPSAARRTVPSPCGCAWISAALALLSAACAVTPPKEISEKYRDVVLARQSDYRIKPGDNLRIDFYGLQSLDLEQGEVNVRPDGRADLFFLPDHQLAGKTVDQVKQELQARARAQVRDADVSIQVDSKLEKVYLVGQFVNPGTLDLGQDMTLGEAVSAVGGTRVTGHTSWALLHRPYHDPEHPDSYRIDLDDIEGAQLRLLPGDRIVLERTWPAKILNYVQEYVLTILDIRLVFGSDIDE